MVARGSAPLWLRLALAALLVWAPIGSALHLAAHANTHAVATANGPASFAAAGRLAHAACDAGEGHVHRLAVDTRDAAPADGPLARHDGSTCAVCLVVAHGVNALATAPSALVLHADALPPAACAPIDVAVAPLRPYASRAPPFRTQST